MAASQKIHLAHLDGLRGISILLVAVSHAGFQTIVPGGFGLTVFFFISGFLITSLLMAELEQERHISLYNFYMRRVWRLLPALLVYIALSLPLIYRQTGQFHWAEVLAAVFYLTNYYKLFEGFTQLGAAHSPFNVLFSLAIEEHFYLFFAPLVAWIGARRGMRQAVIWMIVLPLLIRIGVTAATHPDFSEEYTYRATECRLDSIAWGCLLALVDWRALCRGRDRLAFCIGLGMILASLLYRDVIFRQTFRYTLQGLGLLLVIAPIVFSDQVRWVREELSRTWIVWVGQLSYSVYLYHWLAIIVLQLYFRNIDRTPAWQALYWAITLGLSVLSYYLVEKPCLRLRRKYGSNA